MGMMTLTSHSQMLALNSSNRYTSPSIKPAASMALSQVKSLKY